MVNVYIYGRTVNSILIYILYYMHMNIAYAYYIQN
jgi:hypothetical protein